MFRWHVPRFRESAWRRGSGAPNVHCIIETRLVSINCRDSGPSGQGELEVVGGSAAQRSLLRDFAVGARSHAWAGALDGRAILCAPADFWLVLEREMPHDEFAAIVALEQVRTAPAGARAFRDEAGRSTAVIPDFGDDYVRTFAPHELLHFSEHRRKAAESYLEPEAGTIPQLAAVYRSEYTVERTRGEIARRLGWQPTAFDHPGDGDLVEQALQVGQTIRGLARSARWSPAAGGRAWQTLADFLRMWAMELGARQAWYDATDLPAAPFVSWPWGALARGLQRSFELPNGSLAALDQIVCDEGLRPLIASADRILPR